ncbi:hypothetical protein [Ferrimonas balearica]|uniref:hypothetical protein n=1 Tax=Ferrimonas balearica TaxID=44012 RepID=UPI001F41A542|nr:hypothetical protein [Ferrimonas balearica]MBY6016823.1 hypothetical protein [Halomonas denitrificans]MBY6094887.1 hypothetical protein [Ferrimonas balearica]
MRNLQFLFGRPHLHVVVQQPDRWHLAFFDWLSGHHPTLYRHIRFGISTGPSALRWPGGKGLLPWVPTPVTETDLQPLDELLALEQRYLDRELPVFNPVSRLNHSRHATAIATAQELGIGCTHALPCDQSSDFDALSARLGSPLIVRELAHLGRPPLLVGNRRQWAALPWNGMIKPMACRQADASQTPEQNDVLGVLSGEHYHETRPFVAQSGAGRSGDIRPLRQLQSTLGLSLVAFEFSRDNRGNPVIWRVSPLPSLLEQSPEWLDPTTREALYDALLHGLLGELQWHYDGSSIAFSADRQRPTTNPLDQKV